MHSPAQRAAKAPPALVVAAGLALAADPPGRAASTGEGAPLTRSARGLWAMAGARSRPRRRRHEELIARLHEIRAGMWALHKGRRTVGEELRSWVGPCGARNPIGVPETRIDRATVANAEEHTTLLTRLMDAIASTPSSQRSDGRRGRRDQDEIGADTLFVGLIFRRGGRAPRRPSVRLHKENRTGDGSKTVAGGNRKGEIGEGKEDPMGAASGARKGPLHRIWERSYFSDA